MHDKFAEEEKDQLLVKECTMTYSLGGVVSSSVWAGFDCANWVYLLFVATIVQVQLTSLLNRFTIWRTSTIMLVWNQTTTSFTLQGRIRVTSGSCPVPASAVGTIQVTIPF